MKKRLDDHLHEEMNKEQEIPGVVRQAFNDSYATIRSKSKKKKTKSLVKPLTTAAACAVLASGVLLSNDKVFAKLQEFLGLEDPGIELATQNGDVQYSSVSQSSQDVTLILENTFTDTYRVGLEFDILQSDINVIDIREVSIEYRIYDATGKEIDAHVSDTKPLASQGYTTNLEMNTLKGTDQSITLALLLQSNELAWPSLDDAQLVIETIHFYTVKEELVTVNGEWPFTLKPTTIVEKSFEAANIVEGVQLQQATLTNGSMHMSLVFDKPLENKQIPWNTMALANEKGETFYAKGANIETIDGQTVLNLVFPYSIWNGKQQLSLNIDGYGRLKLTNDK